MNASVVTLYPVRKSRSTKDRHPARDAHRMEEIGRYASGIVHDFNGVLASIGLYAEMLVRQAQDAPQRLCAERMAAAAARGRNLVGQLLAYVRNEGSALAPVDLGANVAGAVDMVRALAADRVAVATSIPREPLVVNADATQLDQVVTNLCTNALQAMPEGGTLRVGVTAIDVPVHRLVTHGSVAPGRHAVICVEDDGCGMDPATLARAFEPFFTSRGGGRGTGLGLAIVQSLVDRFGGAIDVRTAPGAGTRFSVYLPMDRP